jgi:hypothetical protein
MSLLVRGAGIEGSSFPVKESARHSLSSAA